MSEMSEIFSEGQAQEITTAEYNKKLGDLFEKNRPRFTKHVQALLRKQVGYAETDRTELAKDMVQNVFVSLLEEKNINFSLSESEIESYLNHRLHVKTENWIRKYYGGNSKNPFKVPEKSFVPIAKETKEIEDNLSATPYDLALTKELGAKLDEALQTLSPREEKIMKMRFGLHPYKKERTLEEVSQAFAVTRERIRQVEAKALRKMRNPKISKKLSDYQ